MLPATREAILLAAERLFAERGFGVSLREIGAAAGQRNNSAVQYHFGSKDALITALYEYRMVPLNQRRLALLAELRDAGAERDLTALLAVYVRPLAEYLRRTRGEGWYARFVNRYVMWERRTVPLPDEHLAGINQVMRLLGEVLPDVPAERFQVLHLYVTVVLADLEQRYADPGFGDEQLAAAVADLVVTAAAMLTAPAGVTPRAL